MAVAWNELLTPDIEKSRKFYADLLGWGAQDVPSSLLDRYVMFTENGEQIAGMMTQPEETPVPTWFTYLSVDDIDAATARVSELGGAVIRQPFAIPEVGRIAIITDSTGAMVGLFQPGA